MGALPADGRLDAGAPADAAAGGVVAAQADDGQPAECALSKPAGGIAAEDMPDHGGLVGLKDGMLKEGHMEEAVSRAVTRVLRAHGSDPDAPPKKTGRTEGRAIRQPRRMEQKTPKAPRRPLRLRPHASWPRRNPIPMIPRRRPSAAREHLNPEALCQMPMAARRAPGLRSMGASRTWKSPVGRLRGRCTRPQGAPTVAQRAMRPSRRWQEIYWSLI